MDGFDVSNWLLAIEDEEEKCNMYYDLQKLPSYELNDEIDN